MNTKELILLVLVIILSACSSSPSDVDIQTAIAETNEAQPPATIISTPVIKPTNTLPPTSTLKPIDTPLPTDVPDEPTVIPTAPGSDLMFARNHVATQEIGGLIVEITRLLFSTKEVAVSRGNSFDEDDYDGYDVVGEIIFTVVNTTDKKIVTFPDLSTIVINDEQIYLWDWPHSSYVGEGVSGEIFPGVTLIGGTWFGIKRSEVPEINKIIVSFRGPNDGESYESLGPDFYFDIDLSEHIWEEIPEDLADEIR